MTQKTEWTQEEINEISKKSKECTIERVHQKTQLYTRDKIKELYNIAKEREFRNRENKEWLTDEHEEKWYKAIKTLSKISYNLNYCATTDRLLLLESVEELYNRMCTDIKENFKELE